MVPYPIDHSRKIQVALLLVFLSGAAQTPAQDHQVDFRFAPGHCFSLISLPADWQKSAITTQGALAHDFGPGPYAQPLSEISIWTGGDSLLSASQSLDDPDVPIVRTLCRGVHALLTERVFSLIPKDPAPFRQESGRVSRIGGFTGCIGWFAGTEGIDPAFNNVAWGTNRPIIYRVKIEPNGRRRVALGILEAYKQRPGSRILELKVEGAPALIFDPLAQGKRGQPHVLFFDGRDTTGDGRLSIEVHAAATSPDPNVFLNAFWLFADTLRMTADEVITGAANSRADLMFDCGSELELWAPGPRTDALRAVFLEQPDTPCVRVRTQRVLSYNAAKGMLQWEGTPYLFTSPKPTSARRFAWGWELVLPAGSRRVDLVVVHGNAGPQAVKRMPDLDQEEQRIALFWRSFARAHPVGIQVPDSGIQFLLKAGLRTVYQAADIVDGSQQFQPGPTVYRGLWVGDLVLTGVPMLEAGHTREVRAFLESTLRHQLPDGRVHVMVPTVSLVETPMTLYAMWRYARTSDSKQWLTHRWGEFASGIRWLISMREHTLRQPALPYGGLMPPGFVDGGVSTPMADYGSVWWAMIALEKGIDAARWLGKKSEARDWKTALDGFSTSVHAAIARDMRADGSGNIYLPIGVADTSKAPPQRGQYAFLLPLPYGDFFTRDDSLIQTMIRGTLGMLDANMKEGLVVNSGWMDGGVWPWLGGIHSIAHNVHGDKGKALDLLYAFANHASPAGTWVEEQLTHDKRIRTSGDASDAEAGAVFIADVRSFLIREWKEGVEIFPNLPREWCRPGGKIELKTWTGYGRVYCSLDFAHDGKRASLQLSPIDGHGRSGSPVVVMEGLAREGYRFGDGSELPARYKWNWREPLNLELIRN